MTTDCPPRLRACASQRVRPSRRFIDADRHASLPPCSCCLPSFHKPPEVKPPKGLKSCGSRMIRAGIEFQGSTIAGESSTRSASMNPKTARKYSTTTTVRRRASPTTTSATPSPTSTTTGPLCTRTEPTASARGRSPCTETGSPRNCSRASRVQRITWSISCGSASTSADVVARTPICFFLTEIASGRLPKAIGRIKAIP